MAWWPKGPNERLGQKLQQIILGLYGVLEGPCEGSDLEENHTAALGEEMDSKYPVTGPVRLAKQKLELVPTLNLDRTH